MKREELIEKWLEALESGKYKQGKECLVREDEKGRRYCCLGVVCLIAKQDMQELMDEHALTLPMKIRGILKMGGEGDFVTPIKYKGEEYISLANLNDRGVRFKTIARIIREQMTKGNFKKP